MTSQNIPKKMAEEIILEYQCMKQIIVNKKPTKTFAMVSQKMQSFILLGKKQISHDISF